MASRTEGFTLALGLLAVLGVGIGHLGINLWDDYFDYKVKGTGFREEMVRQGFRARIGKCVYITSGQATMQQLLTACVVFSALALLAGFVLFLFRGGFIGCLAGITALAGISYSGAPLRLSYHGLGELLIGFVFGPLLMTGVYYAGCGHFEPAVFFVSVPIGLLVANIVYTHSIMDYEPDKAAGKMTFAVLLKEKRRMLLCSLLLLVLPFVCIGWGVAVGQLPTGYLFTFLSLPMACYLFYLLVQFVKHPERKFAPRFWMGPMGDWQRIQRIGIDWFMIRWLLSRNLLSCFCLIIIIITFIS
jgi:1,4-dihydroxy-2-naphthoate octaprenyltransferase